MKLTPQEILNQVFAKKFKGYDPAEVTSFLQQIVETMESEIQEKEALKAKIEKLRDSLAKIEKKEELLRDTLIAAQKFSSEIKINSHKEAELIIKDAEMKSEEIIKHAFTRQMAIKEEIKSLQFKRKEIESRHHPSAEFAERIDRDLPQTGRGIRQGRIHGEIARYTVHGKRFTVQE